MNSLSFLSVVSSVLFILVLYRRSTTLEMDAMNFYSLLVCGCLAWWMTCDAFFYVAPTEEAAWLWHRVGALGWCGFVPVTAYFFLVMSGANKRMPILLKHLYWFTAAALTLRNLCMQPTCCAEALMQSDAGLGWTFVQSYHTILPWLFIAYLAVYLGSSLGYLLWWQATQPGHIQQQLARGFLVLDLISVVCCTGSMMILPHFTSFLPPLGCIGTLIFLAGYWLEIRELDVLHIELALNPHDILDQSLDALLIVDYSFRVLYANQEARRLLDEDDLRGRYMFDYFSTECRQTLQNFSSSMHAHAVSQNLILTRGVPVVCSISRAQTWRKHFEVFILSLHDIGQLKMAEERLNYLAHYDDLTGLPNRRRLGEILDDWARHADAEHWDFELLFLDLNHFKLINDQFGHHAGDLALIAVADALRNHLSDGDEAARISGDEFILLHRLEPSDTSMDSVQRLRETVAAIDTVPFAPGFTMDAAIGTCRYSHTKNVRILLKTADERMYRMKESGR